MSITRQGAPQADYQDGSTIPSVIAKKLILEHKSNAFLIDVRSKAALGGIATTYYVNLFVPVKRPIPPDYFGGVSLTNVNFRKYLKGSC